MYRVALCNEISNDLKCMHECQEVSNTALHNFTRGKLCRAVLLTSLALVRKNKSRTQEQVCNRVGTSQACYVSDSRTRLYVLAWLSLGLFVDYYSQTWYI